MVLLQNNKNITVTFEGLEIKPNGSIKLTEEQWAELYKKREVRESVAIGYLTATKPASAADEHNVAAEPKNNKKGK